MNCVAPSDQDLRAANSRSDSSVCSGVEEGRSSGVAGVAGVQNSRVAGLLRLRRDNQKQRVPVRRQHWLRHRRIIRLAVNGEARDSVLALRNRPKQWDDFAGAIPGASGAK